MTVIFTHARTHSYMYAHSVINMVTRSITKLWVMETVCFR